MSTFRSQKQWKSAVGGELGPEMQARAHQFATQTKVSLKKLPVRVAHTRMKVATLRRLGGTLPVLRKTP